jgi:hypothetical protein
MNEESALRWQMSRVRNPVPARWESMSPEIKASRSLKVVKIVTFSLR